MSNYIVEDEIKNDYHESVEKQTYKQRDYSKYTIIGIAILIVMIIIILTQITEIIFTDSLQLSCQHVYKKSVCLSNRFFYI